MGRAGSQTCKRVAVLCSRMINNKQICVDLLGYLYDAANQPIPCLYKSNSSPSWYFSCAVRVVFPHPVYGLFPISMWTMEDLMKASQHTVYENNTGEIPSYKINILSGSILFENVCHICSFFNH
jgi:hypothetical protein